MGGQRIIEVIHNMMDGESTNDDNPDKNNGYQHSEDGNSYEGSVVGEDIAPESNQGAPEQSDVNKDDKPAVVPLVLMPSLRGKYEIIGNSIICKGVWAMSDAGHDNPDQTSPFEFKLVKAFENAIGFPTSGKYQGWFFLKQAPPFKGLKIDDKDMMMKFIKNENDSNYKVEGRGLNRFGSFFLNGTLSATGEIQLYREYLPKAVPGPKRGASENKPKVAAPADDAAHREGSGRIRKVSSFMKEYEDSLATKPKSLPKPALTHASTAPVIIPPAANGSRSQRLPASIVKCAELLKEMIKMPQAIYFLEPVDYIKLGIPDYATIITRPMDFGTINKNIEKFVYETPEQFAEHMRLVFRNAITYNQMRDHPVHVAARELNAKFEDKFRTLLTNISNLMAGPAAILYADQKLQRQTSTASKKGKSSRPSWTGNKSRPSSVGGGARFDAFLPPMVDANSASLIEMQRKMQEMQDELITLKTTIRQTEVKNTLEIQRTAAQNPLTFDEKRNLIAQIHKLPAEKMDHVVEIIQAAMKPGQRGDGNDEIEIPLDELDTLTLRKLQKYVEDCNRPKKRASAPLPVQRSSSMGSVSKRPRVDRPYDDYPQTGYVQSGPVIPSEYAALDEDVDLLFDSQILEEEGLQGSQALSPKRRSASARNDLDNFVDSDLATLLSPNALDAKPQASSDITIVNATAWSNPSTNNTATIHSPSAVADDSTSWSAMASELKAKEERERQRKEEVEKLTAARAQQEAERIAALKRSVEESEQQRRAADDHARSLKQMEEERLMRDLQERKDEERRRRIALESSAAADSIVDHRSAMMMLDDDDL